MSSGKVMHFARFAGFEHQADPRAGALADQMMMQAGNGQQRGDGRISAIDAAVGQDQDGRAGLRSLWSAAANRSVQRLLQALLSPSAAVKEDAAA